jgi:hypothetical protein
MEAWIPTGRQNSLVETKQTLHWKEVQAGPRTEYQGLHNHALDPEPETKAETPNLYTKSGLKNHAEVERIEREKKAKETPAPVKDAWQTLCEGLTRDGSHGQQENMKTILKQGIAAGKQFRQIYTEMAQMKKTYQHSLPTSRF